MFYDAAFPGKICLIAKPQDVFLKDPDASFSVDSSLHSNPFVLLESLLVGGLEHFIFSHIFGGVFPTD